MVSNVVWGTVLVRPFLDHIWPGLTNYTFILYKTEIPTQKHKKQNKDAKIFAFCVITFQTIISKTYQAPQNDCQNLSLWKMIIRMAKMARNGCKRTFTQEHLFVYRLYQVLYIYELGPFAWTCNPSKWEADIWGWLEVRRSAMLHFNKSQRPHWACQQYGHTGETGGD